MNKIRTNSLIIFSFIFISFFSISLLMIHPALIGADDLPFHFKRISALILMIKHGQISPIYSFNYAKGSAVMYLYPYLSLIPITFISLFIKSKIMLMYVYFSINVLVSLIVCFYSSLNFSRSSKISYLFALVYSLSNTFLGYSFISMDIGLELAYVFLPLIFFGFFDIINDNYGFGSFKFILGMILVVSSHVLTTIVVILFMFVLFILNIHKFNKKVIDQFLVSVSIILLITSVIWFHAITFLLFNKSYIHMPTLAKLMSISTKGFIKSSLGGLNTFGIGMVPTITLILALFFYKNLSIIEKQMYFISFITIIICSKLFPWNFMPNIIECGLKYFQFTYRFFVIPILFLSYIFSVVIIKFVNVRYIFMYSLLFVILLQLGGQVNLRNKIINEPPLSTVHLTNTRFNESYKIIRSSQVSKIYKWNFIEYSDYYPKKSINVKSIINNNRIIGLNNSRLHRIGYNTFLFKNRKGLSDVSLPLIHYKNEHIKLTVNNDNYKYYVNKNDLISLKKLHKGKYIIHIYNTYKSNRENIVIDCVSLLGVLLFLLKIFYNYKYKNNLRIKEG